MIDEKIREVLKKLAVSGLLSGSSDTDIVIDDTLTAIKKIFLAEMIARLPMKPIYNEEGHSNEDNERDIGYNEHCKETIKLLEDLCNE